MKKFTLNFNYLVADFVSQFNLGLIRKVRFIKIPKTPLFIRLLRILYTQGVIRTLRIEDDHILVFYKYINGQSLCKLKIVSRPGKRSNWTLGELSLNYNNNNFSGFYIISTSKGLVTSDYCLLNGRVSGEILIKVSI